MTKRIIPGLAVIISLLLFAGLVVGFGDSDSATASTIIDEAGSGTDAAIDIEPPQPPPSDEIGEYGIFAKYEGIDGESKDTNHDKWINVLSVDWGAQKPGGGATGQSRRRGSAVVEDLMLTMEYEKSTPKLQEKCLKGEVIPKLEIELTATYGGARATYLKYELTNVMVTSFQETAYSGKGKPTVVIGNNFEQIKVTYTEYDYEGNSKGNVEYSWKVEKGG